MGLFSLRRRRTNIYGPGSFATESVPDVREQGSELAASHRKRAARSSLFLSSSGSDGKRQSRSLLDLVIRRPLEPPPPAASSIPDTETTPRSRGKLVSLPAVIAEAESEGSSQDGATPTLEPCPTTPRPVLTSFLSRRRSHLEPRAASVSVVPERAASRSNPNLLSAVHFLPEPTRLSQPQPQPHPQFQTQPHQQTRQPRRLFSTPANAGSRTGLGILSHHASTTALVSTSSPHDSPPPYSYAAHAQTTTSLLTVRHSHTHTRNAADVSESMGLAEALVVLTAPVDTAPMMKLEDVAFMDESLLDDTNAAQTLGKHTATTRYAPATLEPHRGSDSCSGTPEAFTPTSQKAALAALLMPPSEASAKPPASTENSLFGLASTAAGNDEDAAAAREIMLAAQQSFADHDAGRRFQPSPHIRRLHESPSLPESPTLGFENEVWRKLSNKYVRPRPPPAHFVDSDGSSSAQSSSVSEASGDEAVEELVAEYEAGALVVKAIRIEVGVPASTVSLSPIAEVSDVATPRPSTPRSVEETTVLKAATTDVSLNTPTASVYLSLPPTPEHETTTGVSRMVPSDSVDSVYHLAPSSPVDRASVYVSLPNTPVASTSLSLHQPPHDERTSVYVSLPNTPELSNEDLATVTSSTLGLSHTSLNITPPTPENGSPMTPHEECFSTAPEAVLTAEAALDTFLTPVDGKPEQWVTAPTTPAETGPREAYSVSTTPTSPASPTTPRGSMPPLPESATSPVMQQAALSRSAPGSIRRSKRDSTGPPTTIAARRLTPPMFPPPSRSIPSTPPYPPASNLRSASFSSSPKAAAQRRFVTSPTASTFAEAMATTTKPLPTTPPPVTPPTPAAALPRTPGKTPKSSPRAQAPPSPEPATLGEFMGLFRNIRRREEGVSLRDAVRKAERRSGFFQGVEAAQS